MKNSILLALTLLSLGLIASDGRSSGFWAQDKGEVLEGLNPDSDYEGDDNSEDDEPAAVEDAVEAELVEGVVQDEVVVTGPVAQYIQDVIDYEDFGSGSREDWSQLQGLSGAAQARDLVRLAVGENSASRRNEVGQVLFRENDDLSAKEAGDLLVELCKASVVGDDLPNEVDAWLHDENTGLSELERNILLVDLYEFMLPALKESFESSPKKKEFDQLNVQLHAVMVDGTVPEEGTKDREFYDKTLRSRDELHEREIQPVHETIAEVEEALAAAQKAKSDAAWDVGVITWLTS